MSEYIVDDQLVQGIINEAYRKGKGGAEVWTQREWRQEPVVRCKDCKHFNDYHGKCHRPVLVINDTDTFSSDEKDDGNVYVVNVDPNGFCAWGERHD